jgi:molecular chaperone HscB
MKLDDDDFTLFGLPRRHALDAVALDARWRALQAEVHPDRHAAQGAAAQRVAMQWSVRVNEAYRRLRDPLRRGAYLCELAGVDLGVERNTAMPPDFLVQQMAWREALDDAADLQAVQALEDEVVRRERELMVHMARQLDDEGDAASAAVSARSLMFMARFREDIGRRLEALEA